MSHVLADSAGTLAGTVLLKSLLANWLSDSLESLFKRLFIKTKRQYVIWTHSVKHKDNTPDHTAKVLVCRDPPCDLLHMSPHDLGLPPGN